MNLYFLVDILTIIGIVAWRGVNAADCSLRGIFRPFRFCLGLGLSFIKRDPFEIWYERKYGSKMVDHSPDVSQTHYRSF